MKKAKVIEVMGIPNCGKTKYTNELQAELKQRGIRIRYIQDQIRDASLPHSSELELNHWAIRRIGMLIEEAKSQDWDLILVEAGPWTRIASLQAHLKQGKIIRTKRQKKKARRAIQMALLETQEEDYFIFIELSASDTWRRSQELGYREGGITNPVFLKLLEESFESVKEKIKRRGGQRMRIIKPKDFFNEKTTQHIFDKEFDENIEKLTKFLTSLISNNNKNSPESKKAIP